MDDFRDRPTPPMSLLHAAALLVPDFDVRIVDQRIEHDWRGMLRRMLSAEPVAVGVTTLTGPMVASALQMVEEVRRHSGAPVVWGGTHVSMVAAQAIESPAADYVVQGEGEEAFSRLVRDLASGGSGEGIPGVWSKNNSGAMVPAAPEVLDYASLPMAPYHLVDMSKYAYTHQGLRAFDYLSSRGCPHGCAYCYNTVFYGRNWSARPADLVIGELTDLRAKYDFDAIYFLDDNFFIDKARAWKIVSALPNLGVRYEIQGIDIQTIAGLSDADLDLLEETGLVKMTIGVESASDSIRRRIGKWGDMETVGRVLQRLANRRFLVLTSFIIGFPFESWNDINQTVRFALALQRQGTNFRFPQFYSFTPVQGTAIARDLEEQGFEFPSTLDEWENFDWDHCLLYRDDPAKRRKLEAIAFLSKFIDRKYEDYGSKRFVSLLYRLYRPVAFARLGARLYDFLPERGVYNVIKRFSR